MIIGNFHMFSLANAEEILMDKNVFWNCKRIFASTEDVTKHISRNLVNWCMKNPTQKDYNITFKDTQVIRQLNTIQYNAILKLLGVWYASFF